MAALERFFLSKGSHVAGYDRTPTELTASLESEGVEIVYDDDPALIPAGMRDRARRLWSTPQLCLRPTGGSNGSGPMDSGL